MGSIRKGGDDMTLKPCPFCGSPAEFACDSIMWVECSNRQCRSSVHVTGKGEMAAWNADEPTLAALWNNRPTERAAAEKMREACAAVAHERKRTHEGPMGQSMSVMESHKWARESCAAIGNAIRALDIDRVLEDRT